MKRDFDKELTVKMMVYARDTYPYDFTYDELFDMCIDTYNNVCRGEVKNLIWWFEKEKEERDDKYILEDIEDILMELKDIEETHNEQLMEELEKTFSKSVDK